LIPEIAFFSYRLFGGRVKGVSKRLGGLEARLARSDLALPVDIYLSFVFLISLIVFFVVFVNSLIIFNVVFRSLFFAAVVSIPVTISAVGISFAFLYNYPGITATRKRRAIDESLPYAVTFMGILSSAGVPPDRLFRTLAALEQRKQIGLGGEARLIYRDMEALGEDMISVLKAVSRRRISVHLSALMEGIISTITSGGQLTAYLDEEGRSLMRMRRSILKEFIDTMTMVSEMFMAVMVAFPLILIVMFVVMSSIGGGSVAGLSPSSIIPVIIYGLVPGAGLAILVMIDSITPK